MKYDSIDSIASIAIIDGMASLTIRNFPESTKKRLRIRAAEHGHSMEAEARSLIERGLAASQKPNDDGKWVENMLAQMRAFGNAEFELPEREAVGEPIDFSGPEFDL